MTTYVTRAQWGARAPNGSRNALSSSPKGHAIHWEGPTMGISSHSECAGIVRGIQSYHMDTQGWADIAYSLIACPHDTVYECRGKGVGSSANGTSQANHDWYAICALVGEGDPQPAGLITAIGYAADLCRDWGAGDGSTGHRDHIATECPGDELYARVTRGEFKAGSSSSGGATPTPPPDTTGGGKVPTFPYPTSHYLGQESPDPECHSGYYTSDQPNIRTWQQQMAARGWTIDPDGFYGPQSETVCRQFQTEKNLDLDGLVGPDTWGAAWTAPVT